MKLSSMRINDLGKYKGRLFIVYNRWPDDRSSGITEIRYENGGTEVFVWDKDNPEVEYIGKGKLETKIIQVKE